MLLKQPLRLLALAATLSLTGVGHAGLLDLGTLGGASSQAWGMRADGTMVVGSSLNGDGELQAFRYTVDPGFSSGAMSALPTLAGGNAAKARAINASGTIAGYSRIGTSAATERATVWSGGLASQLVNVAGGTTARAYGISNGGTAVGWVTVSGARRAFRWEGGSMTLLALDPSLFVPEGSEALAISPNGRYIVGKAQSVTNIGETNGFLYDTVTGTTTNIVNSTNTTANGGSVGVGGPFGGQAAGYAVNAAGMYVGTEFDAGAPTFGFVSDGNGATDLNSYHSAAGVSLQAGTGIADAPGVFSGYGDFNGSTRGFLLTIPEPSSGLLTLLALPLPLRRRRKVSPDECRCTISPKSRRDSCPHNDGRQRTRPDHCIRYVRSRRCVRPHHRLEYIGIGIPVRDVRLRGYLHAVGYGATH